MRRLRNAKIVATLGPASGDAATIAALFAAGADVFRFNFSHGSHEDHATAYRLVREAACPVVVVPHRVIAVRDPAAQG